MINIKNILCPIDFSEYSSHALRYAITLAERFKSRIHVVHVLPNLPFSHVPYYYHNDVLMIEEAEKAANKELEKVTQEIVPSDVQVQSLLIKEELPFLGICNYAINNEIDLIVISTHGYGGLQHTLFGSTAERVVREATCPVLTVKKSGHDFIN